MTEKITYTLSALKDRLRDYIIENYDIDKIQKKNEVHLILKEPDHLELIRLSENPTSTIVSAVCGAITKFEGMKLANLTNPDNPVHQYTKDLLSGKWTQFEKDIEKINVTWSCPLNGKCGKWDNEDRAIFKIIEKFGDKELSYLDYAKAIQELCNIKTLEDTQECLFYENGIYNPYGEIKIKKLLLKLKPELKLHEIREIIGKIKQITGIKRDEFDKNPHKICLKNCIVDVKTRQTEPHDPEKYYRIQIPVTYDPKAKCPKFTNFVNTCHPPSDERIMLMEQASTPLLGNLPKLEAMYFNVGSGDNGKSTCFEIITWVYGTENISTVSFHDLVTNRFAKARLEGKLLNMFPDIGSDALDNLNPIKPLISGDAIDAEYKYQNPHTFVNHAKMFFSANELPEIKEKTFADFKRIRVIKWTQRFLKPLEYTRKFSELKAKLGEAFTDLDIENELTSSGSIK